MRLTVFNGSPRGTGSNTKILMDSFAKGFLANGENEIKTVYLNRTKELDEQIRLFKDADHVILAFPLYTDAMPGIVKSFIEALDPLKGELDNPSMGYVVHSGFPEPNHSRYVEKYLQKLTRRLGTTYQGTAIRGGTEGVRMMPKWMIRKLLRLIFELGQAYTAEQGFSPEIIHKLAPREQLSKSRLFFFKAMDKIGMVGFYWDSLLKKNKAYDHRFAQPFKP